MRWSFCGNAPHVAIGRGNLKGSTGCWAADRSVGYLRTRNITNQSMNEQKFILHSVHLKLYNQFKNNKYLHYTAVHVQLPHHPPQSKKSSTSISPSSKSNPKFSTLILLKVSPSFLLGRSPQQSDPQLSHFESRL